MLKLNKHLICTTILCTSTLMSGIASADPWDHGPERGGPQGGQPSFSDDRPHHHGHPQDMSLTFVNILTTTMHLKVGNGKEVDTYHGLIGGQIIV